MKSILATLTCLLVFGHAMATEYSDFKRAMIEAIDASGGKVTGVVVGPIADQIAATTGSKYPVTIDVVTVKSLQREGCKRLKVRLKQANVRTNNGKQTDFVIDYVINLCSDGFPPTEGMDFERVVKYQ